MLKIFQRIRRKLLDEGNLKKYMVYAIGEILLIVIGILVAFQVNNWNKSVLNKEEENRILTSFHAELLTNRSSIENQKLKCKDIKSAILSLMNEGANSEIIIDKNSVDTLIGNASWYMDASTIEMAATDAIILGGRLSIIGSEELRVIITKWNRDVKIVQKAEKQDYDAYNNYWMPFLRKHAYLPQISNSITKQPGSGEDDYLQIIHLGSNSFDHSAMIKEREFQNLLLQRLWVMDDILHSYEQLNPKLDLVIDAVSSELRY